MAELAEVIDLQDKAAIERFISCVRNALWLAILHARLVLALWVSAAILLLAGLIHLFFYNLPIYLSLILALLPMIGGIFVAVKDKPTSAAAATHADGLFSGKSLMTTATDLLNAPTTARRDFSPWIIKQAARTALLWHEQFKQTTVQKQHRFPWAATGMALVGLFFILQPGVPDKRPVTKVEGNTLTSATQPALTASLMNEIKKEENALQNEALSSSDELTEALSPAGPQALSNKDIPPQAEAKQAQANDLPSNPNSDNPQTAMADPTQNPEIGNNPSQAQNRHADAGIGTQADANPSSSPSQDAKMKAIKLVDIKLPDGILVSSDGKGTPFDKYQFTGANKHIKLPATVASRKTSTAYTTRFSPSQQHYVNAYFKNIHAEK